MNARNPTTRSPSVATHIGDGPNAVLVVLPGEQLRDTAGRRPSRARPGSNARIAGRSSGVAGRIVEHRRRCGPARAPGDVGGPPCPVRPARASKPAVARLVLGDGSRHVEVRRPTSATAVARSLISVRRRRSPAPSASASASASPGGTSTASSSVRTSAIPPTLVATIGRPSASASMTATGRPSYFDASVNTSNAAITRAASRGSPVRMHRVARARARRAAPRSRASSGPWPTATIRTGTSPSPQASAARSRFG